MEVKFNTNLEILVIKVMLKNINIHICNIYFPSSVTIDIKDLDKLMKEIPYPRVILGDINAKYVAWGSDICDTRGDLINDWAFDNNLCILNDGTPTRYDKNNNKYSHIDISLIDNRMSSKFKWMIKTDRLISDHFPIVLDCDIEELYVNKIPKWIMEKGNWDQYREDINLPTVFGDPDED